MTSGVADVLVLGAGLAGLRAALAALEQAPGIRVAVVSACGGPHGSSFANLNNALGILAPDTETERTAVLSRALEIAPPGLAVRELAELLTHESAARLEELLSWGLPFRRGSRGELLRFPACFLPRTTCAAIFSPLSAAHDILTRRAAERGAVFLEGFTVLDLPADAESGRIAGAALAPTDGGSAFTIRARAVVAALGGPAPLFARHVAGPGVPGFAYALLARAGARIVNAPWLQYLWHDLDGLRFFSPAALAEPGSAALDSAGRAHVLPPDLAAMAPQRATHCPIGHGLPDAALDRFLCRKMGPNGVALVRLADGDALRVAPMAHAGNGGALVDVEGSTGVKGLYAAGECAAGMHGANRIGGGMVAATQVFGRRAGAAAARFAASSSLPEMPHLDFGQAAIRWTTHEELLIDLDRFTPAWPQGTVFPTPGRPCEVTRDSLDTRLSELFEETARFVTRGA